VLDMAILLSHLVRKVPLEKMVEDRFSLYELDTKKSFNPSVPKPVLLKIFLEYKSNYNKFAIDLFYRDKKVGSDSDFYEFDYKNKKSIYLRYTPIDNEFMFIKNAFLFAIKHPIEIYLRNLIEENTKKDYLLLEQRGKILFLPKNYNMQINS
jgi:hypothetical protein